MAIDPMEIRQLITDMQACPQTEGQSVYEHGLSVREHTLQLIDLLRKGQTSPNWILPSWIFPHSKQLLGALMPQDIIDDYTIFHDCGKPYCKSDGQRRFPNHAEASYHKWLELGGHLSAARLMRYDMMIHTMKATDLEAFASLPEAATLLIVGLAEIHANATMFGGLGSTSFKIKWRQIDRRGKAICKKLFQEVPEVRYV